MPTTDKMVSGKARAKKGNHLGLILGIKGIVLMSMKKTATRMRKEHNINHKNRNKGRKREQHKNQGKDY